MLHFVLSELLCQEAVYWFVATRNKEKGAVQSNQPTVHSEYYSQSEQTVASDSDRTDRTDRTESINWIYNSNQSR